MLYLRVVLSLTRQKSCPNTHSMNLTRAIDATITEHEKALAAARAFRATLTPGKRAAGEKAGCGVKGCKHASRSKGYCATHYLKLRKLTELGTAKKLGWKEYPAPGTIENKKGVTS